jgi:tRNA(Ile)-lysidine synthase
MDGAPPVVAVAYSGGRDSTALLHVTCRMAHALGGLRVVALHVHHGLQPAADQWLAHCRHQCERWARDGWPVALDWTYLHLAPRPGQSVEAVAREARYRALAAMARRHGASVVLLAHHRRDQAETFLLQALRGAGAEGLSAMPRQVERDGLLWVRPWLDQPREAIEHYVAAYGLPHVEDDSNADPRYGRNRLRLQVWPALAQAFGEAEVALANAALHAQDARACAADLAGIDLARVEEGGCLRVEAWLALSPARRRNVLRHWYRQRLGEGMPASLAARVVDELRPGGTQSWPLPRAGLMLRHWRQRLEIGPAGAGTIAVPVAAAGGLRFDAQGGCPVPGWGGRLVAEPVPTRGLAQASLARLELRPRQGGEQFQLGPGRPPRSLKKQYQAVGVPAWQRSGPLGYVDGQLVYVPGLGIDARAWAPPGSEQVGLRWVPDAG